MESIRTYSSPTLGPASTPVSLYNAPNPENTMITTTLSTVGCMRIESPERNRVLNPCAEPTNEHLERVKKSQLILEKYPDRVPLIVQPSKNDRDAYPIDKSKYITPRDLTLLQFQQIIRKRIKFPAEKALFLFINNKIFPITAVIGTIYDTHKDSDGFLYVTYCQESTFG